MTEIQTMQDGRYLTCAAYEILSFPAVKDSEGQHARNRQEFCSMIAELSRLCAVSTAVFEIMWLSLGDGRLQVTMSGECWLQINPFCVGN